MELVFIWFGWEVGRRAYAIVTLLYALAIVFLGLALFTHSILAALVIAFMYGVEMLIGYGIGVIWRFTFGEKEKVSFRMPAISG